MSIENLTLVHFRHFRSLLTNDLRLRKITYEKINLFLTNKPNFRKSQMNVSDFITTDYDKMDT